MQLNSLWARGFTVIVCVFAAGCGGGGGGGTTQQPQPVALAVSSSTPATTTNVDTSATASVTFNTDIDSATVSATSLALTGPVGAVAANRSTTGATVTLTPQAPLVWGTRYTLSTTNALKDKTGQSLAAQFQLNFSTSEPIWTTPATLTPLKASLPSIAFDGKDDAIALWVDYSDEVNAVVLRGAQYDGAKQTWTSPVQVNLGLPKAKSVEPPIVAADASGNAVAVWSQEDANGVSNSYGARFDRTTGTWGNSTLLSNGTPDSFVLALKMDAAGNAFAIGSYLASSSGTYRVFVRRFSSGNGQWSDFKRLNTTSGDAISGRLAVDAKGNAIAVWAELDGSLSYWTYASKYDVANDSWGAAQRIQMGAGSTPYPDVVMDPAGNAFAVWRELIDVGRFAMVVARLDAASSQWGTPQRFAVDGASASSRGAKLLLDVAGNVTVVWSQSEGPYLFSLNVARYDMAGGLWGAVKKLDSVALAMANTYSQLGPSLVADAAGNVTVLWKRVADAGGRSGVFASRYSATQKVWTEAQLLQGGGTPSTVNGVSVAVDRTGSALALWSTDPNGGNDWRLMASLLSGKR